MNDAQRAEAAVSENRVKRHIFEPSKREVWTIIGKSKEHWIDPENRFCSCPGYYFGSTEGRQTCYHLDTALLAIRQDRTETICFSDEEFADFIAGLVSDL